MHRPSSSIRRHTRNAALGMLLAALAGCGSNPVAPIVTSSNQVAKAEKHPNHANGHERQNNPHSTSGATSGGVTSGSFTDPGSGEVAEPLVIE